jgi:hypothetical protein
MRIACIYLPSFPLQAYLRQAPDQVGAPVALIGARLTARAPAAVLACSRAAWHAGVRPGMSAAVARAVAPEALVVANDGERCEQAARAAAESLLAECRAVDPGEPVASPAGAGYAIYAKVPPRCRGTTFGARVLRVLERQGLRGRVGIADDRFTAWVAASIGAARMAYAQSDDAHGGEAPTTAVLSVPHGGSAAFLAPLPLSLLPIDEDVLHLLDVMGVATLGAFAALPPPSVSRPWAVDIDFQALARGSGSTMLRGFSANGHLVERLELGAGRSDGAARLASALRMLANRVGLRLAGRGRAAARLAIRVAADDAADGAPRQTAHEIDVGAELGWASADESALLSLLARIDSPLLPSDGRAAIEVEVLEEAEMIDEEADLFAGVGEPVGDAAVVAAIARAEALMSEAVETAQAQGLALTPVPIGERAPHRRAMPRRRRRDSEVALQGRLLGIG